MERERNQPKIAYNVLCCLVIGLVNGIVAERVMLVPSVIVALLSVIMVILCGIVMEQYLKLRKQEEVSHAYKKFTTVLRNDGADDLLKFVEDNKEHIELVHVFIGNVGERRVTVVCPPAARCWKMFVRDFSEGVEVWYSEEGKELRR